MRNIIILVLKITCLSTLSFSQTYILKNKEGRIIEGAIITLYESDIQTTYYKDTTDNNGKFELDKEWKDSFQLNISYLKTEMLYTQIPPDGIFILDVKISAKEKEIEHPKFGKPLLKKFSFNFEEDFFLPSNEDRNYTGGGSFLFSWNGLDTIAKRTFLLNFPYYILKERKPYSNFSTDLHFGVTGFTPDSLTAIEPVIGDRPYASLVFLSLRRQAYHNKNSNTTSTEQKISYATSSLNVELTIGMLGWNWYKEFQTGIHRVQRAVTGNCDPYDINNPDCAPYDPLGWHNQISQGGEPTGLYALTFARKLPNKPVTKDGDDTKLFWSISKDKKFGLDFKYGTRTSIGYFTAISGESQLRVGWIKSNILTFSSNRLTSEQALKGKTDLNTSNNFELFLFSSLRPNLIFRNNLLSGQFKESIYTLEPFEEVNFIVLQYDFGISIRFSKKFSATAMMAGRTAEFQPASEYSQYIRNHSWFGIYFNWLLSD